MSVERAEREPGDGQPRDSQPHGLCSDRARASQRRRGVGSTPFTLELRWTRRRQPVLA